MAPNCQQHKKCDLVCPWCGYYCFNEAHEWAWTHVGGGGKQNWEGDMPDNIEAYRNERAEEMP